jgi:carbonic anhydrase/acetyltransferase-like protein (isoleucine patch superfamily)
MLVEHLGKRPAIDPTARIAPTAVICGDVSVGPETSIGFGAVLTAESGPIVIGRQCVIMENAVVRGTKRHPVSIGDHVLVGPGAYLSGCVIRDCVFLATGARVFNGAIVGARAEVRINATVHLLTKVPEDATVPIGWVAVGDPARILLLEHTTRSGRSRSRSIFRKRCSGSSGRHRARRACLRCWPATAGRSRAIATTGSCERPAPGRDRLPPGSSGRRSSILDRKIASVIDGS